MSSESGRHDPGRLEPSPYRKVSWLWVEAGRALFPRASPRRSSGLGEPHRPEDCHATRVPAERLEQRLVYEIIDQHWIVDLDRASQPAECFGRVAQPCGEQGNGGRAYVSFRPTLQQLSQQRLRIGAPSSLRVNIPEQRQVERLPTAGSIARSNSGTASSAFP